ncbi:hypothetical protein F2Q69_00029622 [Brassica cretica]|uniref:Uncharacterized protein n=1 Tax=Brassica cretica TaxID=69181 RepID=A0A8S9S6S6_BRACR|nr:hypothetical protein F2Q69_00029622 [Brassica cretica]
MVTQILQHHSLQLAQSLLFLRVFGLALLRKGEPQGHMVQGKHQESAIFLEKENIDQSKLSSCPHRSGEHFLFRHCKTETRSSSFTRKQIRQASMEYPELWASDHRPIRICFALEKVDSRKRRFFFDKRMLCREGFEDLVRSSWEGKSGDRSSTMERIGRCHRRIMN